MAYHVGADLFSVQTHPWLEDPSDAYRPKHFINNDNRTDILKRRQTDRQTEVLLQYMYVHRRTEKDRQSS